MNIFFIGVVVSILVYIVVGIWAGRSVKDVNDYYVSGRNAPTILIAGTLFASMLSVNGFMGDQGWCYSGNITTLVLLNSMCAMGYIAGPLMFGRYLRRSECTTMPEYFGARYCDLKNRRVAGIITAVSLTAYLLSCITGVGILMQELTGLSYELCLFLAWFCFTAFTFYSGSKGVILTDTMMFMVFLIATIIAGPYVFKAQGGIGHLLENLMNNPNIPENLLDYHVTFRAGAIAAACTVIFLMYLNLQSVTVLNLNPGMEDPQRVLIWAAFHVMPKLVGTLMLAGIMAAGLSSASTFLSVIGFSITSDIVFVEFKSEKQQLFVSRVIMLILGAISLLLAYTGIGSVRIVTYFASTIIAASWGVSAIGSVVSKKLSATGARWSMIAGFVGFIVTKCLVGFHVGLFATVFINFLDPFFIGIYLSLFFAILGSKLHPVTEEEKAYREKLLILPESEKVIKDYKIDKVFGYLLIAAGIAVTLFLLFGWALPYNGII